MDVRSSVSLDLLSRRAPVLHELRSASLGKQELVSLLDVSRSTVDRALRELTARDLVERTESGYRTTLAGRLVLDVFEQFRESTHGVDAVLDVLSVLPHDAPFPPALFTGAEVVRPTPVAPHRPAERNTELLSWADGVRGLISAVSEQYVANYRDAIERGTTVELVFPEPVFERLLTGYDLGGDPMFGLEHVRVRQTTETLPCSVKLHQRDDERVASLTVYDSDGLCGLVTNDSPEAVAWASSFIDEHWKRAEPLPSP